MPTSLPYRPLPSTPCNSYSACLLPTVYLGNTALHSNRSYTLPGSSRQQAKGFALEQFHDPPFLPRTIAFTATQQVHQQSLADRIRITVLEYGSGPLPYLGRSRILQSSYTSRRLADRIRIQRLDRIRRRKGDGGYLAIRIVRDHLLAIGILAYNRQCSGAALPRRRPEGDSIAIRKLSGRSQGGDPTRLSLQIFNRPTTVHSRQRSHQQRLEG